MSKSPLRAAFVGQGVFFQQCALEFPADGLEPTFIDFRAAAPAASLRSRLEELDPDVVLVFRPEIVPSGLLTGLRGLRLGYLTEPLPRAADTAHEDLGARMWWLEQVDPGNFDRIVSFDPLIAETAGKVLPVWRSLPIPVADSFYRETLAPARPPRLLFIGRPTEHREQLLAPLKARYPIVHIGHGLYGEQLRTFLDQADVQLNLHNNPYPTFENRVCIALAAGHLVISEPLSPDHGLKAGTHYLEAEDPEQLLAIVERLMADPDAHLEMQAAGRIEAERFRASRVYPALVRDALDDFAARGSIRPS